MIKFFPLNSQIINFIVELNMMKARCTASLIPQTSELTRLIYPDGIAPVVGPKGVLKSHTWDNAKPKESSA